VHDERPHARQRESVRRRLPRPTARLHRQQLLFTRQSQGETQPHVSLRAILSYSFPVVRDQNNRRYTFRKLFVQNKICAKIDALNEDQRV